MKYLITSDDKNDGLIAESSTSNFVVELPVPFTVVGASLLWASIPSIYNIEASINNRIDFTGSLTTSITIPPGHYTATTLATHIAALLDAADAAQAPHTVTYDSDEQKYTIAPGAGTINLLFSSAGNPGVILGFTDADTGAAATHTSPNVVHLEGPKYLYLTVHELGVKVRSSSNRQGTWVLHLPETTKENRNSNYKDVQYDQKIVVSTGQGCGISVNSLHVEVQKPDGSRANFGNQPFCFLMDICGCPCGKAFSCRLCPNCSI